MKREHQPTPFIVASDENLGPSFDLYATGVHTSPFSRPIFASIIREGNSASFAIDMLRGDEDLLVVTQTTDHINAGPDDLLQSSGYIARKALAMLAEPAIITQQSHLKTDADGEGITESGYCVSTNGHEAWGSGRNLHFRRVADMQHDLSDRGRQWELTITDQQMGFVHHSRMVAPDSGRLVDLKVTATVNDGETRYSEIAIDDETALVDQTEATVATDMATLKRGIIGGIDDTEQPFGLTAEVRETAEGWSGTLIQRPEGGPELRIEYSVSRPNDMGDRQLGEITVTHGDKPIMTANGDEITFQQGLFASSNFGDTAVDRDDNVAIRVDELETEDGIVKARVGETEVSQNLPLQTMSADGNYLHVDNFGWALTADNWSVTARWDLIRLSVYDPSGQAMRVDIPLDAEAEVGTQLTELQGIHTSQDRQLMTEDLRSLEEEKITNAFQISVVDSFRNADDMLGGD